MPERAQLMVLYTNDAVEVRYTNGARLHVLPCGTGFTYSKPQTDAHPVSGMEMIQQRCCYVTSTYRDMVLSALDFRNRFSEQPYLCEELLESDQVVHLYARIKEIAWPKVSAADNTEVMEDGSVCITSEDEFASLILSPHRRDFTVCYLSQLSHEKRTEKTNIKERDSKNNCHCRSVDDVKQRECQISSAMPDVVPRNRRIECSGAECHNSDFSPSGEKGDCGNAGREDLNISPITQASCTDSPQALSNASGSPITPQNTLIDKEAKFRPFSTPTEGLDDNTTPVCTPYGKTAIFNDYAQTKGHNCVRFAQKENIEGSFIGEQFNYIERLDGKSHTLDQNQKRTRDLSKMNGREEQPIVKGSKLTDNQVFGHQETSVLKDILRTSQDSIRSMSLPSSVENEPQTRYKYCWLTRHISCDECPVSWSHVVKMAQEVAQKGFVAAQKHNVQKDKSRKPTSTSKLREINKKTSVMSQLPQTLPLSCPGQHLHKMQSCQVYDDGKNPLDDPTALAQGRLKVLLIDGVIYRIIRLPTIKCIEVYPGDGSVLVSQGMSAHFFLHVIPHGDKVEERTYSIKSPPVSTKGNYSIKSLIGRAHRFLGYVRLEENNLPASVGLCCWKHEESVVIEPVSTSVLEECEIHGYGKFTALSNGQIRIAFKDRTCLDMTCDFSRRVQNCLDHSTDSQSNQGPSLMLADKKAGTCRLLLPNGQYQMIDTDHPGIYKRYIDIAREWADWVNSSPIQRQKFYRDRTDQNINMSVERELQKIQCFNYVVEKTLLKNTESGSVNRLGAFKPYSLSEKITRPSILRNSDQTRNKTCESVQQYSQRTVQIHSPPSAYSKSAIGSLQSSVTVQSASSDPIGLRRTFSAVPNDRTSCIQQASKLGSNIPVTGKEPRNLAVESFSSVREALLRTSSAIKDIDKILEKK